jgi:hypothetical protein
MSKVHQIHNMPCTHILIILSWVGTGYAFTVIVQNSNGSINPLKKKYLGLLERKINDNFHF